MARPERRIIASGIAAWDADVDANFGLIMDAPLPLYQVSTVGDLPDATEYNACFAWVGNVLYISDGTTWAEYLPIAPATADSTATIVADLVTDFNTLLANLRSAGIMEAS